MAEVILIEGAVYGPLFIQVQEKVITVSQVNREQSGDIESAAVMSENMASTSNRLIA